MTTITATPYRPGQQPGRDGFAQLLRSEWTKFRTVRGWVIGMVVAVLVTVLIGLFAAGSSSSSCRSLGGGPVRTGGACMPAFPVGPGGEPVTDSFYLVRQPLAGNGSITVQVTSLTGLIPPANMGQGPVADTRPGLVPWAKAGIIIKDGTSQGSAYAAMMVTADHGVRMQDDYTNDTAGLPGAVSAASPRWLRLTRSGDTITGYDSADGTRWTQVGTVHLAGLSSTVAVGAAAAAAVSCPSAACGEDPAKISLTGIDLGQAVVAIVAVLAISNEYSTGMIRITLSAMPRRTSVLAGKAAVLTAMVLAAGTVAVLASVLAGRLILPGHGFTAAHGYGLLSLGDGPVLRAAAGSVLYLALIALLGLGAATAVRDPAVAIGIVLGLLYLFPIIANVVSDAQWHRHLQQIGPMTAGLAIQATTGLRSLPISPWAGLGLLAAWAAGALLTGSLLLRWRDA